MIAAVSKDNVIGKMNKIPWNYPEDMKFFRQMTLNSVIISGRLTFESFGGRPLPKRRNIVISSGKIAGVETFSSLELALNSLRNEIIPVEQVWLIGGSHIYSEGMEYAHEILLTQIPLSVKTDSNEEQLRFFPKIDKTIFEEDVISEKIKLPAYPDLKQEELYVLKYNRICNMPLNCGHACGWSVHPHYHEHKCLKNTCL